ncbi:uncharacterized protein LOC128280484 [Gossypium arboreum]|uniref:uncharacterized protein LOC128280484 n=1 Tax=Gossypium arboreum TaxID=29729 RepID=UPI0022F1DB6E|nr:uncharacterized protein LOC128280484 [Gossypium arboreum]
MVEAGKPNLADYFPLLKKIGPKGVRHRMTVHFDKLLSLFSNVFDERRQSRQSQDYTASNDVLDTLLDIIEGFTPLPAGSNANLCGFKVLEVHKCWLTYGPLEKIEAFGITQTVSCRRDPWGGIPPNEMNMKEKYGIAVQMVEPLPAVLTLV